MCTTKFKRKLLKKLRFFPDDEPAVKVIDEIKDCQRKTEAGDFIRYVGVGYLMDGTVFWQTEEGSTYNTYLGYKALIGGMEVVSDLFVHTKYHDRYFKLKDIKILYKSNVSNRNFRYFNF